MTSLAGYAPSAAIEKDRPSPWVAVLLTILTPGLGHLYIGYAARGITLFLLAILADSLVVFALMSVLARFWLIAVSLALLLGLWLFIAADALSRARRQLNNGVSHNRWTIYVGAFVLACLLFAAPCLYALRAEASGRLLLMGPAVESMEPTLENGEYFLADATYYASHQPMRGEVAVFFHPRDPSRKSVNRIVAVEGDRIAIKDGHAIVNGIAVAEPYVDVGAPDGSFANVLESRVPAGHVFVVGDNRANSTDSRDVLAHGPVPVANLIGRATDVAFSRHLRRIGRWIGTPSNL